MIVMRVQTIIVNTFSLNLKFHEGRYSLTPTGMLVALCMLGAIKTNKYALGMKPLARKTEIPKRE